MIWKETQGSGEGVKKEAEEHCGNSMVVSDHLVWRCHFAIKL